MLVTLARSSDGVSLDLGLEPMAGPLENLSLGFVNLRPATKYSLSDTQGNVLVSEPSGSSGTVTLALPALSASVRLTLGPQ